MPIYKTKILKKISIAKDTIQVNLKRPNNFDFLAGQYIQLKIPKLFYDDCKGSSRVFSIASSPLKKDELWVAFRNTQSGYKKTLLELTDKDELLIDGPYGFFTLPKNSEKRLIFIAGGVGITPFLSMIQYCFDVKKEYSILLVYCNKDKESTAYFEKLKELQNKIKNFNVVFHYGYLNEEVISNNAQNKENISWFVVGPPAMMIYVENILLNLGVDSDDIYSEGFVGY